MNTLTEDEIKLIARLIEKTPDTWRVTDTGSFTCDLDAYALHDEDKIKKFDSDSPPGYRFGEKLGGGGYLFFKDRKGAMQFNNAIPLMAEKCGGVADRMNEHNQHERLWDAEKGEQVIPELGHVASTKLLNLAPLVVGKTNPPPKEQQPRRESSQQE